MKLWKFLLLLLIAAGLGVYIFEVEKPAEKQQELAQKPLSIVAKNSFKSVKVSRKGEPPFVLENKKVTGSDNELSGSDWTVIGIGGAALDTASLTGLARELSNFKIQDKLPESELAADLSVYGLTEPELVLTVEYEGGTTPFEVSFGKRSDFLTKRYVSAKFVGGSGIYLTDEALFNTANKQLFDYREKSPLKVSSDALSSITIKRTNGDLSIAKNEGKDGWLLTTPLAVRASSAKVGEIVSALSFIRAQSFIDGKDKEPLEELFRAPTVTLSFNEQGSEKTVLFAEKKVTDDEQEYYAKLPGLESIVKIATDPTRQLVKEVSEYREKEYFTFDSQQVTSVDSVRGQEKLHLVKNADAWKVNEKDGDRAFIEEYLKTLSSLSAVAYPSSIMPSDAEAGFDSPTLTVTVSFENKPAKKLTIGKLSDQNSNWYYAKVDGIGEAFFITADAIEKVIPAAEKLIEVMPQPTVDASPQAK